MSPPTKGTPSPRRPRKPDEEKDWGAIARTILIWVVFLVGFPLLYTHLNKVSLSSIKEYTYSQFLSAVQEGQIKTVNIATEASGNRYAHGEYIIPGKDAGKYRVFIDLSFDRALAEELIKRNIPIEIKPLSGFWTSFLTGVLPFLIPLLILWFLFARQMRSMGRGALSFGKSRARLLNRDKNKLTFKDVAGIEEAKDEVQEIVEFLKDPKRFQKLGGRIPKGVLMIGPPGTGKTLLAKAIAGEADVPFFSISGSDFVEMFVGVGASRVRDMFEQGRKSAPCLIFIDEIDAVGRSRFSGIGGGHDEREQTLNALLVEMDGFDTQEGIILIAATNRPDVLDTALLRPGRFDRQIVIDLPDLNGREQILKVHVQKVKLADGVDLSVLARGTPGFSGADLANLINEAALLAARNYKKGIEMTELEEARDKVRFGRERRSRVMDEKDKEITAYHEAGHAIVMASLEHTEPVHKVTIIPRGNAYLGATMQLPEKDRYTYGRKKVLDELATYMGGRIAEEMTFGDITSGAYSDIRSATRLARKMVCEWGMSEKLGFIEYAERDEPVFIGREIIHGHDFSEATAVAIDQEVRRIIDECYACASKILADSKDKLVVLAKALLEYETLDGEHVTEIIQHGKILNPPRKPSPADAKRKQPAVTTEKANARATSKPVSPPPDTLPSPAV
ncbi:MAG: ATP-dependent metallopeptidase FtsH/Yme1/Tma family protein [Verrucomicrobia bacterium]|nr:ATP-dependent metallopeptidase FtsH/Yme1/Tma family protein [Verrucomicrobiota bacterium]